MTAVVANDFSKRPLAIKHNKFSDCLYQLIKCSKHSYFQTLFLLSRILVANIVFST